MNKRVVDILIYIMQELRKNHRSIDKLDTISNELLLQGYTENEISSAFSWLLERMNSEAEKLLADESPVSPFSFRHLHEIERSIISTKAYGYLIQLKELGIINDFQFEQILERALMLGTSLVDIEDIKTIAAAVLFSPENFQENSLFLFSDNQVVH